MMIAQYIKTKTLNLPPTWRDRTKRPRKFSKNQKIQGSIAKCNYFNLTKYLATTTMLNKNNKSKYNGEDPQQQK